MEKDTEKLNPASDHNKTVRKGNPLKLFRQYNTYQSLLDIYPQKGLTVEQVHSKVILYVMKWYCERVELSAGGHPEIIAFVDEEYGVDMTGVGKEHFLNIDSIADYIESHK